MPTLEEPLDDDAYNRIVEGIIRADKIIAAINRATRVGMEMSQQLEDVRGRRKQLLSLKNEYFPGR
jgi:hypothetical protein|tara:strand:- start:1660 stop:1857 length:198 start_codon:yes stop_codon:yes gene_type:complete